MSEEFAIVNYADLEAEPFPKTDVDHRRLTEPFGAAEMRVNAVELDPGEKLEATPTSARRRSTSS